MAEQLFVKGVQIKEAGEMFTTAGRWEEAHKVGVEHKHTMCRIQLTDSELKLTPRPENQFNLWEKSPNSLLFISYTSDLTMTCCDDEYVWQKKCVCVQLAVKCMTEEEVVAQYVSRAQELEGDGKFKEAER